VVPVRFVMFSGIGALGAGVHFGALWLFYRLFGYSFLTGTIVATLVAMTFNFFLNNALTYRDARLKGWRQLLDGWIGFCIVCSVGAVANVGVAAFLHDVQQQQWAPAALAGIVVAAVWNFALSSRFVWGRY
jgi:dolichol-phosphate mannosyltransferase